MDVPLQLPRGIAGPGGHFGYVMRADGSILAIDLETGEPVWQSDAAQRPLAVAGDRLVALAKAPGQRQALQIVLLDLRTGEPILRSQPLTFPPWAEISVYGGEAFAVAVRVDIEDVHVEWRALRRYRGGAGPRHEQVPRAAGGAFRVGLETGEVETAAAPPAGSGALETASEASCVVGSKAYDLVHQRRDLGQRGAVHESILKARDLATGKLLWERTLEERPEASPHGPRPRMHSSPKRR